MSEKYELRGGGRSGRRLSIALERISQMKGLIIIPCTSANHCRYVYQRLIEKGFKANKVARINKGLRREKNGSRRSIWIEVFN